MFRRIMVAVMCCLPILLLVLGSAVLAEDTLEDANGEMSSHPPGEEESASLPDGSDDGEESLPEEESTGEESVPEEEVPEGGSSQEETEEPGPQEEIPLEEEEESQSSHPGEDEEEVASAERVVGTYDQFKRALEDATTTLIRLDNHILVEEPITINPAKPELVIDGEDQDNPEIIYTLTEYYAAGYDDPIGVRSNTGIKSITLRNLNIVGRNHYGTIYVADSVRDVYILYDNITYHGPQMCYNRYGTSHIKDSEVLVDGLNAPSNPGEVGEVKDVILEGRVYLEQLEYNDNEIFYFPLSSGSIVILPDADVTVKPYAYAGFTHIPSSFKVSLTLREGAVMRYTGQYRFYDASAFSGVTLEAGAQLYVDITTSLDTDAILMVNGDVKVEKNAILHLRILGTGAADRAALRVYNGSISFHDPLSVLLYAPVGRCIHFNNKNNLSMVAQQINYWTSAVEMTLDNRPLYGWRKADKSNIQISGEMNLGNWASFTTNFVEGDDDGTAPTAATASMVNARLLALGRADVDAWYDRLSDSHSVILGATTHLQSLARAFSDTEEGISNLGGIAGTGNGTSFEIPLELLIVENTVVSVETVGYYLWASTTFTVNRSALFLSHQARYLPFEQTPLSATPWLVHRLDPDWNIVVYDARPPGKTWNLWAAVRTPLEPADDSYPALYNALIYVDGSGKVWDLSYEILIATGQSTTKATETTVGWPADQGVLVRVLPGTAFAEIPYGATITWRLEDVP